MSDLWWEAPKGIVAHVFADRLTNEILLRPSGFTCQGTQLLRQLLRHSNVNRHRRTVPNMVPNKRGGGHTVSVAKPFLLHNGPIFTCGRVVYHRREPFVCLG